MLVTKRLVLVLSLNAVFFPSFLLFFFGEDDASFRFLAQVMKISILIYNPSDQPLQVRFNCDFCIRPHVTICYKPKTFFYHAKRVSFHIVCYWVTSPLFFRRNCDSHQPFLADEIRPHSALYGFVFINDLMRQKGKSIPIHSGLWPVYREGPQGWEPC